MLELLLAIAGFTPITDTSDPFVGFSSHVPLFVQDTGRKSDQLRTAEHRLVWFNDQSFNATKAKNVRRVFCLGGSTTYGRPYDDRVSFAGWLRELLPVAAPDQAVEVINAGGVSYASYRVANILQELTQYEPDLFVVYSAQNEFLERRTYANMFEQQRSNQLRAVLAKTRCWTFVDRFFHPQQRPESVEDATIDVLPAEVDEMLNHTIGPADYHFDTEWREKVLRHYEFNLRRMVALAHGAGASVVFVTPASNLRDCAPFKSEYSDALTSEQENEFTKLLKQAQAALQQQQYDRTLSLLKDAAQITPRYAQLHYLKGQALFAQQRYTLACTAFKQALNDDVCPLRAIPDIVNAIRRVAKETDCPLVDYEKQLKDRSQQDLGHACIGREYFLDHVHPTIDEHREIALALLEKLDQIGFVKTTPLSETKLASISKDRYASIDPYEEGVSFRNLAKVYHWSGKFNEALPMAKRALQLIHDDAASLFIAGECERLAGNTDEAIAYLDQLIAVEPFHFDAHVSLGMLLADRQQYEVAALHLSLAVSGLLDSWYAHQEYGVVLFHLAEFEKAFDQLQHANDLSPANARTLYFLAKTAQELGMTKFAIARQRELLELEGPTAIGHYEFAKLLEAAGQMTEARAHFASAHELNPKLPKPPDSNR